MGLPTTPVRKPQPESRSPQQVRSNGHVSCDDWLRGLFSGTLDLREAEARAAVQQRKPADAASEDPTSRALTPTLAASRGARRSAGHHGLT